MARAHCPTVSVCAEVSICVCVGKLNERARVLCDRSVFEQCVVVQPEALAEDFSRVEMGLGLPL